MASRNRPESRISLSQGLPGIIPVEWTTEGFGKVQKNYREGGVGLLDAAPGTYLVSAYFDDNQVELIYCNVLGWQVGKDRRLTPMCLDIRAADDDAWFVIHPDGRVESNDGRGWDNKDAWIADHRRSHRAAA